MEKDSSRYDNIKEYARAMGKAIVQCNKEHHL